MTKTEDKLLGNLIYELIIKRDSLLHACGCDSCNNIPNEIDCLVEKINKLGPKE